jgi:hypothetical protein
MQKVPIKIHTLDEDAEEEHKVGDHLQPVAS